MENDKKSKTVPLKKGYQPKPDSGSTNQGGDSDSGEGYQPKPDSGSTNQGGKPPKKR